MEEQTEMIQEYCFAKAKLINSSYNELLWIVHYRNF